MLVSETHYHTVNETVYFYRYPEIQCCMSKIMVPSSITEVYQEISALPKKAVLGVWISKLSIYLDLMKSKPPESGFHEIQASGSLDFMKSRPPET